MKPRDFIDKVTATTLAVIVHVVLFGIIVLSLDYTTPGGLPKTQVEPVKAVVVDESQVAEEIEQIKKREEAKRKLDEKRARELEREADKAREQRKQEEKRLSELQRRLAEEKREHDARTRKQREEAAKALAEVNKQKDKELEELQELKRAESDLEQRRLQGRGCAGRAGRAEPGARRREAQDRGSQSNTRMPSANASKSRLARATAAR